MPTEPSPALFPKAGCGRLLAFLCILGSLIWAPPSNAQTAEQALLNGYLAPKTVLNASAANLAAAVASAIKSGTSPFSADDLATCAFEPVGGKVRSDRNTSSALVAASAIAAVISASGTAGAGAVDAIADSLVTINGTNTKQNLNAAGQAAVVKAALGSISDYAASNSAFISLDESLGQTLAADFKLESLPDFALLTLLQNAMAGINGASGKAQAVAPAAAGAFVQGLISGAVPDGAAMSVIAVDLLKKVSKNTNVVELVAYQAGLKDNSSSALINLAGALYQAYPAAAVKVTQGLTAAVPQGLQEESLRIVFIQQLAAAEPAQAVSILDGAVFTDPYFAGQNGASGGFTTAVFNAILASPNGTKQLAADAPKIASTVGAILGQNGDGLTAVAVFFSQLIATGKQPSASAATYSTDLIPSAVKSTVVPFTGAAEGLGGGILNVGTGINAGTASDLASILDLLADGIVKANGLATTAQIKTVATQIGALAKAIATFTKNEAIAIAVPNQPSSEPIASYLAGTLASYLSALNLPGTPLTASGGQNLSPRRSFSPPSSRTSRP